MMFFKVLIVLGAGQFDAGTYQFLESVIAQPYACIVKEVGSPHMDGQMPLLDSRCIDKKGRIVYVGPIRETSII